MTNTTQITAVAAITEAQIAKQEQVSIIIASRGKHAAAATFVTDHADYRGNKGGLLAMPQLLPTFTNSIEPSATVVKSRGNEAAIKATIFAIETHFGAIYDEEKNAYVRPDMEEIMSYPVLTVYTNSNVADYLHAGLFKHWLRDGEKFSGASFSETEATLWVRLADLYQTYFYALNVQKTNKLVIREVKGRDGKKRKVQHTLNQEKMELILSLIWDLVPEREEDDSEEEDLVTKLLRRG